MRLRVGLICLSLFSSFPVAFAATPPKFGNTCAKAGLTQNYNGLKFTCIKSGKKLVWDKGTIFKKVLPTPSASPTPSLIPTPSLSPSPNPTMSPSPTPTISIQPKESPNPAILRLESNKLRLDPSICKLKEVSKNRAEWPIGNGTAFPFNPTQLPIKGEINVAAVFVDWEDLPGTREDYDFYQQQLSQYQNFYWMTSEHKLKFKIVSSSKWFRIPGTYSDYTIRANEEPQFGPGGEKKQKFYDAAVAASDANTDFKGMDIVILVIPRGKSVFERGPHEFSFIHNAFLKTQEGNIFNVAAAGDFFLTSPGQPPWVYYVHETGHMIGIPHQANEDLNKPGVALQDVLPLGGWDIMSNQMGASRTISSWLRWYAGWLDDSQVVCISTESISDNLFELVPINTVGGEVKSVVIKISNELAIVVESRRFDSTFDLVSRNLKDGVIVYTVDATKGSAQGSQRLLSPRDITKYLYEENTYQFHSELDVIMSKGDVIEYRGIRIEALLTGGDSDFIRVIRTVS